MSGPPPSRMPPSRGRRGIGGHRGRRRLLRKVLRVRVAGLTLGILGVFTLWSVVMTQLTDNQQLIFALICFLTFLVANRLPGRGPSLFLVALSFTISLRYIVWRATTTLNYESTPAALLGTGLVLAEIYALVVMTLGYLQTTWVLERKPVPLPPGSDNWPTVDVYVPTYNEDLDIVRVTVLAAMSMDYPSSKLRVYVLDDGKRPQFREFAESCGAGYITRTDNTHAKAGNLNHALKVTDGEYIAIFDCDHIPTRAFLQMTLGWLVRDRRMALVQTPHHFYTLDPFEKNLAPGTRVPNEGNLFYGLIQPGNDLWNAAFFCGSCAVLRRSAVESIGGFAVETVTEDAHTALRLHRNGWNSAFLRVPLAAGLATERLSAHIGQRARWARGMIQIFRVDNPLFGPGLSLGQRLCYLSAMLHFLYPLPRLVFLTSPLAFLILGQNIIAASPLAIIAYGGPHIMHTIVTNSRLQSNLRHSFWSEIYETVLALVLIRPTMTALLDPGRGKFNVTAKGTIIAKDYFDVSAVRLNVILLGVLGVGLARGLYGIAVSPQGSLAFQAFLLNTIWVTLSLIIVSVSVAVGLERRQPRRRPRLKVALPAFVILPDGREIPAVTHDISRGGVSLVTEQPLDVPLRTMVRIILPVGGAKVSITSRLLYTRPSPGGQLDVISFHPADITEETAVIRAMFGRADAWVDWNHHAVDRPFVAVRDMLSSIVGAFRKAEILPEAAPPPADDESPYETPDGEAPANGGAKRPIILHPRRRIFLSGLVLGLMLPAAGLHLARAQDAGTTVNLAPGAAPAFLNPPLPPLPNSVPPATSAAGAASPVPANPAAAATAPVPLPSPSVSAASADHTAGTRTLTLTLGQLGATGPLNLRGNSPIQGVLFGTRADEVVTGALLTLNGAMSPSLLPNLSNVTVTLNEQYVGTIPVDPAQPQFGPLTLNINPAFFLASNRLNFRFAGAYTDKCNDPLSPLLWATISNASTLTLILTKLPPTLNLSTLPAPFFDPNELLPLQLPFVLAPKADDAELQAAGVVASWFGKRADFRRASFTAIQDAPPQGDAVVFAVGNDLPADLSLPPFQGPTLTEIANPNDPTSSLLIVGGRTDDEVVAAAQTLSLGSRLLSGASMTVDAPTIPVREPYDAPNWLPTDRKVRLGELVNAAALNGAGYADVINVPFQTAPDLYNWRQQPFKLDLLFRAPPGPILDVAASHLDVSINGTYLASTSLAPRLSLIGWLGHRFGNGGITNHEQRFLVDVPPYDLFAQNELQMNFDTRPFNRGACTAIPGDIRYGIDPDSTINLTSAYHFTAQPRLDYFRSAGYPYSIYADLSRTAVVLPDQPDAAELSAYLTLMGRFGRLIGYPSERVTIVRPEELDTVANDHLLVLANLAQLQQFSSLLQTTPVRLDGDRLIVPLPRVFDQIGQVFGDPVAADRRAAATLLQAWLGGNQALLMGAPSPLVSHRVETVLLGASSQSLVNLVQALDDVNLQAQFQADLSVLSGGTVTSYQVRPKFWIGWIPPWLWPTWFLRGRPDLMLVLLLSACLVTAIGLYWPLRRRNARRLSVRDRQ